jgi:hypothetical protein
MTFSCNGAYEHFSARWKGARLKPPRALGKTIATLTTDPSLRGAGVGRDGERTTDAPPAAVCEEIVDCDW